MTQRLVVLGAGTALPDRDRDNTFLVWDSTAGSTLIDCGGRAYQQLLRAGVDPRQLRSVVLTHNHPDHIYGLPALLFHLWLAGYRQTLAVYANPSTLATAQRVCAAFEHSENGAMCPTSWHEIPEAANAVFGETCSYRISTTPVRHSRPTLAVKIEDRERQQIIVYSSDTAPCDELAHFAQGAHTLIHEAATDDPFQGYGHSTPRQAGEMAVRCGVQRIVLIHYSSAYTMSEAAAIAEVRATGFGGEIRIANELDTYVLDAVELEPQLV